MKTIRILFVAILAFGLSENYTFAENQTQEPLTAETANIDIAAIRKRITAFTNFWNNGETPPEYRAARQILGNDFIFPEEIEKNREAVSYTEAQLQNLIESIPPQETLQWLKENDYVLIAGPPMPMNLMDVVLLNKELFFSYYSINAAWYTMEEFAINEKVTPGWIAIRKKPIPGSPTLRWNEQLTLLSKTEVIPNIAEVSYFVTTVQEVRQEYLFPLTYVRTSTMLPNIDGIHVMAGYSGKPLGMIIAWELDEYPLGKIFGLASMRKLK